MPNANADTDQDADAYGDTDTHYYADAAKDAHTDCHSFPGDGLYAWLLEDTDDAMAEDTV